MRPGRIAALVMGALLAIPAFALLIGGASLAVAYALGRDGDGYFTGSVRDIGSDTAAITTDELDLAADPGAPDVLLNAVDLDVRIQVTAADGRDELFVGIAPSSDVDAYLAGVAHDEIVDFDDDAPLLDRREGAAALAPPTEQDFWTVSAAGPGTQEIDWEASAGRWAVVVANADGQPGLAFDADVGAKAGVLANLIGVLLVLGTLLAIGAVSLLVLGASGAGRSTADDETSTRLADRSVGAPAVATSVRADTPVLVEAELDPDLSRWQWLVKWFLAIPHLIVLFFLWIALIVLTIVAGFAILFTGRYPRGIFDFNVGVLRWSWRVTYYATTGGIGTDRYPPFTLAPVADYPASFDVAYPEQLSRWLVLVKWWLLAIPHYVIIGILAGGAGWSTGTGDGGGADSAGGIGLLGILVLIAGVILLVTSRYPRPLFDLIIGLNRWIYRVMAYALLMTDRYPPFRLDQGGSELRSPGPDLGPDGGPPMPPPATGERHESLAV